MDVQPKKSSSARGDDRLAGSKTAPDTTSEKRDGARQHRILLVEDEFLVAMTLENDLSDAGFQIVGVANSAEAAVNLARQQRPDLIVMDVRLVGHRNGIDAALEIFSETGIRCIFATAHADPQSKARAEAALPLAWIQKPYAREALVDSVKHALIELRKS